MQRQSVIPEDICLAAMEAAVDSSPVPARLLQLPHRAGLSRTTPGRNLPPNLARCRPELVTALETAYAVRRKEIG
jgi:hypothetical protein